MSRDTGLEMVKNHRGYQVLFRGEKFENANYSSFERARLAE